MTALSEFSDQLADLIAQAAPAVVNIQAQRSVLSGVHWRPGVIVTTVDAVRRQQDEVTLMAGDAIAAKIIGQDAGTDIAVLQVENLELPTAQLGDLETLRTGHLVLALGRSEGDRIRASAGILAELGTAWQSWTGGHIDRLLRPDITPFPGFTGSPLLDSQGHLLGINTTYSRGRFAVTIPTTTVNRVVDQLLQRGRVAQGYLGIGLQPVELPNSLKQSLDLSQAGGILIVSLETDGPADGAGVLMGDILVTLVGEPIETVRDLRSQLAPDRVGQPVTARLIRGGQLLELSLTIGER
ncbi:trypsin-like peptidase domain-containing protein [Romeria aff. gracilis LEGE 07310]|uniref:Trypsin-like peptidase domain-containing protein n=1 Tax=Vasconcelosia minhoensis LEGE 07310 TaxID=915328 RepID=A0A8J7D9Z8_9CYAN|nr:trypsin-like peptidase domain-containing protein [Romeria gracilis]MBE9075877.1 trypsin-like peptidase domain-containing protein [Romeria aff. gracilis LEGE 07310]